MLSLDLLVSALKQALLFFCVFSIVACAASGRDCSTAVRPLNVSLLWQPLLYLDVSVLHQSVLPSDVSVLQQSVLPLDMSVLH